MPSPMQQEKPSNTPHNMNTKHTPGPWRKTDGNAIKCDLRPIGLTIDAGMIVASVVGGPRSGYSFPQNESEVEANARLIAAAPELLEALKEAEALLSMPGYKGNGVALAAARAAIAKATGENI